MPSKTPFVSFYHSNEISPVSQDISDKEKHFQRRDSLFRSLGVVPNLVKGRTVLEFGPGSGHNALYTASLSPAAYNLVEGNLRGVEETRKMLSEYDDIQIDVHHCLFEEFKSDDLYDLVWAEGCLPHQSEPLPLLEWISRYVTVGGVLCITTASGVSYLSETLRRLFRDRFFEASGDVVEQAERLVPYLKPHLTHLRGRSRPITDWILDNIIQPLHERKLLMLPQVISCLDKDFEVYGSSPRFLTDWRWYKEIVGRDRKFNDRALNNYYRNNLNLMDYRFEFPIHSEEFGMKLEQLGSLSWDMMCRIEKGEETDWSDLFNLMEELCSHVEPLAPDTVLAIREAVDLLQGDSPDKEFKHFPMWWGRGQQYVSFVRK